MRTFEEIASSYNTEELLSAIIGMQFFGKIELRDTYLIASEMFASNALRKNISSSCNVFSVKEHFEVGTLAKRVLHSSWRDFIDRAIQLRAQGVTDEIKNDFLKTVAMEAKNIAFRGDGYVHQLIQTAEKLYRPLDNDILEKLGFTFSCYEAVILYVFQKYHRVYDLIIPKISKRDIVRAICKKITRRLPYTVVTSKITTEYRIYKTELYERYPKKEIDAMLSELAIKPGDHTLPEVHEKDFKLLYAKPFVDFGEYIYLPLPESTLLNLPKLFHYYFVSDDVFSKDIKGSYNNLRGSVIEELTISYLSRLFDEKKIYQSLQYPNKKKTFEADVTVQGTDFTIFAECKAKLLVSATLSGNITALKDDVYKAIGKAYEQAIRTIKYTHSGKTFYLKKEAREIKLNATLKNYILCINIEHFGFVPSEIKSYIAIDKDIPLIPLAINVFDLDIITAECEDSSEFLQYLDFRAANIDSLSTVDELDSFLYFKKQSIDNILKNESKKELIIPLNLTGDLDFKYQPIATEYVLTKNTEYTTQS